MYLLISANRTAKQNFSKPRQQFSKNHNLFWFFRGFLLLLHTKLIHNYRTPIVQVFKTTLARQQYAIRLVHEQIYIFILQIFKI